MDHGDEDHGGLMDNETDIAFIQHEQEWNHWRKGGRAPRIPLVFIILSELQNVTDMADKSV